MYKTEEIVYPLTHSQKRIWYMEQINYNSHLHNIGGCLKIKGSINVDLLQDAINITIRRNEGLRLRFFHDQDGRVMQYVQNTEHILMDFIDFSRFMNPVDEHTQWVKGTFSRKFNLEQSQLYYFSIYKINEIEYGVLLKIHHLICDGWSIGLIQKQVCDIYSELINNNGKEYEDAPSFIEYIKKEDDYLKSEKFTKHKAFWKREFSTLDEPMLYKTSESVEGLRETIHIDNLTRDNIQRFQSINNGLSLNTLFLAVSFIYTYKLSAENSITMGIPVFNRSGRHEKNMVGMFTSTMPFRLNIDGDLSIMEFINLINRQLKTSFVHQKYPYDLLIKDLELGRLGYDTLFRMSVNCYNMEYNNCIDSLDVEVQEYYSGHQSYSLQLIIQESDARGIDLSIDYKKNEYSKQNIRTMFKSMIKILQDLLVDPNQKIGEILLLDDAEVNYKSFELNSTACQYPKDRTIVQLFEEQVEQTPDRVAVILKDKKLTFKQLNRKINQMANYLKDIGVKEESIVGLMLDHSIELIVGLMAILKAGGTYLPIDSNYPDNRIKYILEDSNVQVILTDSEWNKKVEFSGMVINLVGLNVDNYSKENLNITNNVNHAVYIIYTSGSTGKPKGVIIEHKGLVNYICWAQKMYLNSQEDVFAFYSSISFDLTVTSIFTPMLFGAAMAIYSSKESDFILYDILKDNIATVVKLTPAHLSLIKNLDNTNSSVKRFIVGGEDLKVGLAKDIVASFGGNIEIYNEYGPTETVVGCMIYKYEVGNDSGFSVPIGRPADNVQLYILNHELNLVPDGIPGELYISGDGLARGYLNKEVLTNERFISNPFNKESRMYRTNDLAKYLNNGVIEYIGRNDKQIKQHGYRIEVGEIESCLMENDFVEDAVVLYQDSQSGNKSLNAYLVPKREINEAALREYLKAFLPGYMIPANFIFLEKLPLTPNGKVDSESLHLPDKTNDQNMDFLNSYDGSTDYLIITLLRQVLGDVPINMDRNFYELGGDSIKAIQLASKLQDNDLDIRVKDILSYDSIRIMMREAKSLNPVRVTVQEECTGEIKETPITEWYFKQNLSHEDYYNQYLLIEFKHTYSHSKIEAALKTLITHHDMLRSNYNGHRLFYNNDYLNEPVYIQEYDISSYSHEQQRAEIQSVRMELGSSINIKRSRLFHIANFHLAGKGQALLFVAHHLIVDGVSWRIIIEDFMKLLAKKDDSDKISLSHKTASYSDWAEWLSEYSKNEFINEEIYWKSIIEGMDYNTPKISDSTAGVDTVITGRTLNLHVKNAVMQNLTVKSNEFYNLKFDEILLIALIITISKVYNRQSVCLELERHGREVDSVIDVSRTVGWFTAIYPASFQITYPSSMDALIKSLKEQIRSIPSQGFNYGILKYLKKQYKQSHEKNIRFNYLGDFDSTIRSAEGGISNIESGLDSAPNNELNALIDINSMIIGGSLNIAITYSYNRFSESTIQNLLNQFEQEILKVNAHLDTLSNKILTPSDFDAANISQEDLDLLFS